MNMPNESKKTRVRAMLLALAVALVGLTIAPGFKCTYERDADGDQRGSIES